MNYDNPQFIAAVRKIISDSLSADPKIESDKTQENPSNECQAPIAAVAELRTQIPIRVHTKADDTKPERVWKWIKGVLEVFGILAVIIYTILANKQWHEMISARHQTQPAIQAAENSSATAGNALKEQLESDRIEHRPYIVAARNPEDPFVASFMYHAPDGNTLSPWQADVYFKNFGRSTGMEFQVGCRVTFGKDALKNAHGFVPWEKNIGKVPIPPGGSVFHTCTSTEKAKQPEATTDYGTDYYLVVFGQLQYLDMWDKSPTYYSDFCYLRLANGAIGNCPDWHYVMK